MSEELKALERIKEELTCELIEENNKIEVDCEEELDILKSALERKEKLEKVWEIVKKCQLDVNIFIQLFIKNDYNYAYYCINWDKFSHEFLTETEFNLLKEMLK